MTAVININPVTTTNAAGTFSITLDGFIQGMAMDDPAMRYQMTGGLLDSGETLPMWGGVAIEEFLVSGDPPTSPNVKRSTSSATITGFSVFNQNYAAVNTPQSPVPTALPGMLVNLYRVGSLARIAFAADPALAASLPTLPIMPSALYWDPVNFYITANASGTYALSTNTKIVGWNSGGSMTVSYSSVTGFSTWVRNGNCVLLQV